MYTPRLVYPFIHPSVDTWDNFHPLAMVNNAAVNIVRKYLFEPLLSVLLDIYPEVELLHHT